jgi:thiol-disulfide isomerase/thioredoxin
MFPCASDFHFLFIGCGHCKKAKPEFMQAAEKLNEDSKVFPLSTHDITEILNGPKLRNAMPVLHGQILFKKSFILKLDVNFFLV